MATYRIDLGSNAGETTIEEVRRFGRGRFISRLLNLARYRYARAALYRLAQHPPRGTFAACFAITTSLSHHARTSRGLWPSPALPWTLMRSPACQLLFVGGRRNQPHTRRRHASASRPAGIAYEPTNRTDPTGTRTLPPHLLLTVRWLRGR